MIDFKRCDGAFLLRPYQERLHSKMASMNFAEQLQHKYLSVAPGGGKTLMGITFVIEEMLKNGYRVLWLAWDWLLLEQAYETLLQQYKFDYDRIGYASASPPRGIVFTDKISNIHKWQAKPDLLFTTPRIWMNQESIRRRFRPDLIVLDEAHYGLGGVTDRDLKAYYKRNGISVLGLSGTPKRRREWELIRDPVYFRRLVLDGYLAEPVPTSIKTGLHYEGRLVTDKSGVANSGKMISQDTIRELTEDHRRNTKIVDYIKSHRLGKTIVFAGNKDHADVLGAMLSSHGSVVIHEDADDPKNLIHDFKNNHYRIAVCVNMLRQGINIPDVNSIVITIPTTSDIAYFQMACRGNRISEGKKTFNLIDVEDTFNNSNFRALLVHPAEFFFGGGRGRDGEVTESTLLSRRRQPDVRISNQTKRDHSYKFSGQTFTLNYGEDKPLCLQRLSGMRIVTHQTFGVECELTHKSSGFDHTKKTHWMPIAEKILDHIRSVVTPNYCAIAPLFTETAKSQIDYEKWNVVYDGSCGWEIVSPILLGKEGFEDLVLVFDSMEKQDLFSQLNLDVDTSTGMHLHLGWDYSSIEQTKRLIHAIRRFSPAFYSMVAPSRLGNEFCKSVKNFLTLSRLEEIESLRDFASAWDEYKTRYHDVNFQGVRRRDRTFEIRLHSGTYDGIKMAQWVALWMNLVHAIDRPHVGLNVDSTGVGRGIDFVPSEDTDIVQIAVKYLGLDPKHNAPFLEKLYSRRLDIFSNRHWKEKLGEGKTRRMLDYWQKEYRKLAQL